MLDSGFYLYVVEVALVRVGVQFGLYPFFLWVLLVSLWPYALWFGLCYVCMSSGFSYSQLLYITHVVGDKFHCRMICMNILMCSVLCTLA